MSNHTHMPQYGHEESNSLWEGFWGIVIFGVEIENIGNELEIDSDLQVGY